MLEDARGAEKMAKTRSLGAKFPLQVGQEELEDARSAEMFGENEVPFKEKLLY